MFAEVECSSVSRLASDTKPQQAVAGAGFPLLVILTTLALAPAPAD